MNEGTLSVGVNSCDASVLYKVSFSGYDHGVYVSCLWGSILVRIMSNVEDDERLLLSDIKRRWDWDDTHLATSWVYKYVFYPTTSYILKNVTELRLDGWKMAPPSVSNERSTEITEAEFNDAIRYKLHQLYFTEMMEQLGSMEVMDEHTFALSFMETQGRGLYMHTILVRCLASFAMTHGVWLLVLKFIFAGSSEEEDMHMVLKRVVSLFVNFRWKRIQWNENGCGPDFCMYISLLSSTATRPSDDWKSMESLYNLILAMQEVGAVVHFLLSYIDGNYISKSLDDGIRSLLLLSVYWVAYGVAACSSQCNALPKNGYVIKDSQKLIDVCDKLTSVRRRLQKLQINVKQFKDDEKIKNAYDIPNKQDQDSYSALMALFGHPLLDRPEGSEELKLSRCDKKDMDLSVTTMKPKILLLLISGLDISSNEIDFLRDTYIESKTSVQQDHEVVWIPILSSLWTTSSEEKYTKLLQIMPWYMVEHPNSISEETKKFIRQVWKFKRRPIVVVIDENGDVVCPNGIHMIYIWGSKAFPFTLLRERTLWTDEMRLDCLVFDFDPNISTMLEVGKWVILYGGNDIEWSRKFTTQVREVLSDTDIFVEMIYIGENMELERRSYYLNLRKLWYFWTRLESLLISRYQSFSARDNGMDPFLGEVKKLLSYKYSESWACLRTCSSESMIHAHGDIILQGFMEFEMWKQHAQIKDLAKEFQNHIKQLSGSSSSHVCSRMVLHVDDKDAVGSLKCPFCNLSMEKMIQYRCCHVDETE